LSSCFPIVANAGTATLTFTTLTELFAALNMTLQKLSQLGWYKAEPTSPKEIADLFSIVNRHDLRNVSPFDFACPQSPSCLS
jgi:hypothetical protein